MKEKKQQTMQESEQNASSEAVTYTLERRRFIVTTAFDGKDSDSLGSILVRLMQSDLNAS